MAYSERVWKNEVRRLDQPTQFIAELYSSPGHISITQMRERIIKKAKSDYERQFKDRIMEYNAALVDLFKRNEFEESISQYEKDNLRKRLNILYNEPNPTRKQIQNLAKTFMKLTVTNPKTEVRRYPQSTVVNVS